MAIRYITGWGDGEALPPISEDELAAMREAAGWRAPGDEGPRLEIEIRADDDVAMVWCWPLSEFPGWALDWGGELLSVRIRE